MLINVKMPTIVGSVAECLTRDQGAAGSSLTSFTVMCHLSLLSTGSTQEAPTQHN